MIEKIPEWERELLERPEPLQKVILMGLVKVAATGELIEQFGPPILLKEAERALLDLGWTPPARPTGTEETQP